MQSISRCVPTPLTTMLPLTLSPLLIPSPKTLILNPNFTRHLPISKPYLPPKFLSSARLPPPLCTPSGVAVADLVERDYSFLEPPPSSAAAEKSSRIIAAAEIREDSKVLLSFPTVGFVVRLLESVTCQLAVAIHESLLVLAMIKEADDRVRCWQGEIAVVPERFLPFDAVFICYFPGIGVSLDELLRSVAERCSPGARLVISFDQGRKIVEQEHCQLYPDMVRFDLPDRIALEKAAKDHLFQIAEFLDEPTFYLAVLKFHGSGIRSH